MMMADADDGSSAMINEAISSDDDVYFDVASLLGDVENSDGSPQEFRLDLPSMDHQLEDAPMIRNELPGIDAQSPRNNGYASGSTELPDGFLDSEQNSAQDFEKIVGVSSQISFPDNNCSRSVSGSGLVPGYDYGNDEMPYTTDAFNSYHAKNVNRSSSDLSHLYHINGGDSRSLNLCIEKSTGGTNLVPSLAWMEDSPAMDKERHSGEACHIDTSSCEISGPDVSEIISDNSLRPFVSDEFPFSSEFKPFGDGIMSEDNFLIDNSRYMGYTGHSAHEVARHNSQCGSDGSVFWKSGLGHPKYIDLDSMQSKENMLKSESNTFPEVPLKNYAVDVSGLRPIRDLFGQSGMQSSFSVKREISYPSLKNDVPNYVKCYNSLAHGFQTNSSEQSMVDDDSDLCIIEHMSAPPRPNPVAVSTDIMASSQYVVSGNSVSQVPVANSRNRLNDERGIFRAALQDLSLPQLEATPPDGVLSVPLLKHQRIALSWMVNKETTSACCSGGILADDQGLGKTVSTIALILMERSRRSKAIKITEEPHKIETLNLDDDDDDNVDGSQTSNVKVEGDISKYLVNSRKPNPVATGRPSAGTLIVCPTSVLKQWSEELHNKVTREADLLVLVYHGNRTKDPLELAKYDVVITTYAIVSMEVPQQPVVDENDDEIGSTFRDFSCSRKRKVAEDMSDEKPSVTKRKKKKGVDSESLENKSGPLARVNWFRVVLDEAQSIKNHKTQVARACWGLRAKRRWCLSGTPIQNAIDDLYSYFRFLRHEPYAVFRTFCEQIKVPVHRNPKQGYKKLQAVLKTVMLRRTKATLIDGKPIINLPPKTIKLTQVDFSNEERNFYSRLEADSRAQFAEYAAAGTVKQNYVNILLMLLRLRQACDHPLLIKGFDTSSKMTSSIKMANKLPREKQYSLLNCLEASLAICEICHDPPEDAVVTVCGHVFCNQCICEHISGDDSVCPTKKCKTRLSMSDWFSSSALRISLSDQMGIGDATKCNGSEFALVSDPFSIDCPEGSSKIRAALELLRSISEPQDCASRTNSSELIEGSQKSPICDSIGDDSKSFVNKDSDNSSKSMGQKTIVFSQWTRMLDLLEVCLKNSSIQYRRLDGTMTIAARDRAVKDFKTIPEVSVMIMSLKAASLGLNMVAACNVILLDLWWNPTTEDQAIDRAHRIGQTRPVSVYRLTVKETVEDRILALQERKRKMVSSAFGEDEAGGRQTRLTVDDLKYLFSVD